MKRLHIFDYDEEGPIGEDDIQDPNSTSDVKRLSKIHNIKNRQSVLTREALTLVSNWIDKIIQENTIRSQIIRDFSLIILEVLFDIYIYI